MLQFTVSRRHESTVDVDKGAAVCANLRGNRKNDKLTFISFRNFRKFS